MNVLIFSVSIGHGHNQVAKCVQQELIDRGHTAHVIDALDFVSPFFSKVLLESYLRLLRHTPAVYGKLYYWAEDPGVFEYASLVNSLLCNGFNRLLKQHSADAIVCTHSFSVGLLSTLKQKLNVSIPLLATITDFTVHSSWVHDGVDAYVIATSKLDYVLKSFGVGSESILPIGIPVRAEFSNKTTKKQARSQLKLNNAPTVLLMGGGLGLGISTELIRSLAKGRGESQLIVFTGNNERLFKNISHYGEEDSIRILDYVDDVAIYMAAADLLVTKPGGITCAEALCKGLPVALFSALPGQESRNAKFLAEEMVAVQLDLANFTSRLVGLVQDEMRLKAMSGLATRLARPEATKDLVLALEAMTR